MLSANPVDTQDDAVLEDVMSPNTIPTTPAAADILAQAAEIHGQKPPAAEVVQALLDAERAAKHPRPSLAVDALLGRWQLRFTAPNKPAYKAGIPVGKGFYWPTLFPGTITFSRSVQSPNSDATPVDSGSPNTTPDDALTIENQIQLGPLALRFSGPAKFLPKQNLLAFDFVQVQLWVGRLCLLKLPIKGRAGAANFATTSIAKLPFFAFFAATPQYLAARGRGGGLALWVN
ncbi:hypothetical protein [Leptolyngbya sp. BL0902]|uniref:hypothetical protein n=1 Tax=Leptolyngbya sp. BL0902 TaxID=1115757 RepID=UPI0018E884EE|nr:hypothetical protein [Leptolyngbya sp. BL0902]